MKTLLILLSTVCFFSQLTLAQDPLVGDISDFKPRKVAVKCYNTKLSKKDAPEADKIKLQICAEVCIPLMNKAQQPANTMCMEQKQNVDMCLNNFGNDSHACSHFNNPSKDYYLQRKDNCLAEVGNACLAASLEALNSL